MGSVLVTGSVLVVPSSAEGLSIRVLAADRPLRIVDPTVSSVVLTPVATFSNRGISVISVAIQELIFSVGMVGKLLQSSVGTVISLQLASMNALTYIKPIPNLYLSISSNSKNISSGVLSVPSSSL